MEYNRKVDDALPLEDVIKPDPELRALLEDIDTSKIRMWLFTNAYVTHGKRVVKLLQVDDLFEGITYCDYRSDKFYCKPHTDMYDKAMKEAGVKAHSNCYFVGEFRLLRCKLQGVCVVLILLADDSYINTKAAYALGWNTVHLLDKADPDPPHPACKHQIRSLTELRNIFPQFFKSTAASKGQS